MNVAIFASGNGSNAQRIIDYFTGNDLIKIALILSNRTDAYVLQRAEKLRVPSFCFTNTELKETMIVQDKLKSYKIDFIVLAGFMVKIPDSLIRLFPDKIVNIHPALLPNYGGKGMYGDHVHKAVIDSGDKESGISIHLVNENYDEGKIIFQAKCEVLKSDTPETLAARIHKLEYEYYPKIIEKLIAGVV
jgi:phosphoribosylglycinamide formyltransferase-1